MLGAKIEPRSMPAKPPIIATAGGALGLGAFAAAVGGCCGAPWAVALIGVSGAIALARLAFLLPYALIGSAVLLGAAFWWAYRPARVCADEAAARSGRRAVRAFLWIALLLVAALGTLALSSAGAAPAAALPYTVLDDQASELRADFNRARGKVRLLFVVDPICPTCLRGLDDMNRDLLADTHDPRLVTLVVYEPVLGTTRAAPWARSAVARDVPAAAAVLHNPNVHHYWNASGEFGRLLSDSVDLAGRDGRVYAWDVWLVYGPEATWSGAGPPPPLLLMQQLGALSDSRKFPHLDGRVFAERVQSLLAQLPPHAR
jgi:hypothetical protein